MADTFKLHGITSNVPVFRNTEGSTTESRYVHILNAAGAYSQAAVTPTTFTAIGSLTSAAFAANYPVALANFNDGDGASTHYRLTAVLFGTDITAAGWYRIVIVDASDIDASILGSFLFHFDGTTLRSESEYLAYLSTTIDTVVDGIADDAAKMLALDTTVSSVTSQTQLVLTAGSTVNDAYKGMIAVMRDASNSNYPSYHNITGYVGSSKLLTLENAPNFTVAAADGVVILPCHPFLQEIIRLGIAHTHASDAGSKSVTVTRT